MAGFRHEDRKITYLCRYTLWLKFEGAALTMTFVYSFMAWEIVSQRLGMARCVLARKLADYLGDGEDDGCVE
jgi:hypothetical protein